MEFERRKYSCMLQAQEVLPSHRESEDITGLIQAKHTQFSYSDTDYPDLSTMHIKGKLPLPRDTKASLGKDRRLQQHIDKQPFKMKKFDKVKAVMSTQPISRKKPADATLERTQNEDELEVEQLDEPQQ